MNQASYLSSGKGLPKADPRGVRPRCFRGYKEASQESLNDSGNLNWGASSSAGDTPPCLTKGNLPPLRLSLLFSLGWNYTLHFRCQNPGDSEALVCVSLSHSPSLSLFSLFPESGSVNTCQAHFLPGLISAFVSGTNLLLRFYWCFAYSRPPALSPFSPSLYLMTSGTRNSCPLTNLHATLHSSQPLD